MSRFFLSAFRGLMFLKPKRRRGSGIESKNANLAFFVRKCFPSNVDDTYFLENHMVLDFYNAQLFRR